jgi:hypothetical protein
MCSRYVSAPYSGLIFEGFWLSQLTKFETHHQGNPRNLRPKFLSLSVMLRLVQNVVAESNLFFYLRQKLPKTSILLRTYDETFFFSFSDAKS